MLADGKLIVVSEEGHLALAAITENGLQIRSSARLLASPACDGYWFGEAGMQRVMPVVEEKAAALV